MITQICPKISNDKWLFVASAIAMLPVFYAAFNNVVTYMTLNFCLLIFVSCFLVCELIIKFLRKQKITLVKNPIFWFFFAFVFWLFLGSFFTSDPQVTWLGKWEGVHQKESIFQFVAYFLFGVVASKVKKENKPWLLSLIVWLSCFYIALGLLNLSNTLGFYEYTLEYSLMFFHPNHSGYIMCLTGAIAAAKVVTSEKPLPKVLFGLAFFLHVFFLCLNGSMGPIIGFVLALVFLLVWCLFKNKKAAVVCSTLLLVFVGTSCVVDFVPAIHKEAREKTPLYAQVAGIAGEVFGFDYKFEDKKIEGSDGWDRLSMWRDCISDTAENPLFGTGVSTFQTNNPKYGLNNPHNEYLQIFAAGGIPALMFYLAGLICLVVYSLKNKKLSGVGFCSVVGIVSYAVSAFFGNTIAGIVPIFALVVGLGASEA